MTRPYSHCLREILALQARGMHQGLDRMSEALTRLGNPQNRFKSVHIAGTNGKGSTSAMVASILSQAVLKTGLTISPHILDYRERIQLNGEWIPEGALVSLHEQLRQALEGLDLTFFEWTILLAFLYFAQSEVDIAVLETGMGGRWDATNTVLPVIGAITNVSYDHQEYLGSNLEEILGEKMRILKPGMVAFSAIEEPWLVSRLKEYCDQRKIDLRLLQDCFTEQPGDFFSVGPLTRLKCGLRGRHQKKNAALAASIALSLREEGYLIPDAAIRNGLEAVVWPGRLEQISQKPGIILDGAHNPAGVESLTAFLGQEKRAKHHLVFGTLNNRPFEGMLQALLPYSKSVQLAYFEAKQSFALSELELKLKQARDVPQRILPIDKGNWLGFLKEIPPEDSILVTGSLYLVSQVRALIYGGG